MEAFSMLPLEEDMVLVVMMVRRGWIGLIGLE